MDCWQIDAPVLCCEFWRGFWCEFCKVIFFERVFFRVNFFCGWIFHSLLILHFTKFTRKKSRTTKSTAKNHDSCCGPFSRAFFRSLFHGTGHPHMRSLDVVGNAASRESAPKHPRPSVEGSPHIAEASKTCGISIWPRSAYSTQCFEFLHMGRFKLSLAHLRTVRYRPKPKTKFENAKKNHKNLARIYRP